MNRRIRALPAAAGLLIPLLAGCGGPEGGSGGGGTIVVGTTDQVMATPDDPAPLDPAYAYDTGSWNIDRQVLQTLLHVPHGGGAPVGEAASECRFTDHANESYRCTLRPGLTFSNGDPVTPRDVKFSIERVVNINAPAGASGLLTNVDTVETSGDSKVIFHLKTPDATFPYKLATPIAGVVNPKTYEPEKLRAGFEVNGSGPYTLKADVEDHRLTKVTFEKNPRYRGDLKPRTDKVEMRIFSDAGAMRKALQRGDIDVMLRTMTPEQIQSMTDHPQKGIEFTEMPGQEIRYLGFNTDDPSVKDKAVRQAMAHVIDRRKIVGDVYHSEADSLYSLVPSGITGHTNSFFNQYGDPDPSRAAQLLESRKISTPVKLTLNYTTDHYGAGTAAEFAALKKQLNASGLFDVDIQGTPWSKFRPAEMRGEYAVYGLGWFPDFPDPDNYIAPFLDKDNFLNSPYVSNRIRSQLIPDSRREADRSAASKVFGEIQDIVAEDVPVLPLWQGKQYVAARDGISGVEWAVNSSAEVHLWELGRGTGTS